MKIANMEVPAWRRRLVLTSFAAVGAVLVWRAVDLQVINNARYQDKGDAAHLRVVAMPAHRGMILDRNREPLAISTPVDAVWVNPSRIWESEQSIDKLASSLGVNKKQLHKFIEKRRERSFSYVKRGVTPGVASRVAALDLPGVGLQHEFRRFYPTGEVSGHLLGFTNTEDQGLEGLERLYDEWLQGTPGSKRVIVDRNRRAVEDVERIQNPAMGKELVLSIDRRLQFLAYRELKAAVQAHNARSGSLVILDSQTGEVLAMASQPMFNPNSRKSVEESHYRNRVVADLFEPGSTLKPFAIAAALESGKFHKHSLVDTSPGFYYVGRNRVKDDHNHGRIDLTTILQKSSNVGVSKVVLQLGEGALWDMYNRVGFGGDTGTMLSSEQAGVLSDYHRWSDFERATLSFGYGVSVTALQLARAYSVLADDGRIKPVSLLKLNSKPESRQVVDPEVVRVVRKMLEYVVRDGGTGTKAAVPGYHVAGKTGTVRKNTAGGYVDDRYVSLFTGMVPARQPRLVIGVVIDDPRNGVFYGGEVAAPVFSRVASGALRLLDIPPDNLRPSEDKTRLAGAKEGLVSSQHEITDSL